MDMKGHILAALQEKFLDWENLLSGLSEEQAERSLSPSNWSTKDVVAHLMVWQKRSIARVEAALYNRKPKFPQWVAGVEPDAEGSADLINAWIYKNYHSQPWQQVHDQWIDGFLLFRQLAGEIAERDLLDGDRYPWMNGFPTALVLVASYEHHQEHYEKLRAWLRENETR